MNESKGLERVTGRLQLLHKMGAGRPRRKEEKEARLESLSTSLVTTTPTAPNSRPCRTGQGPCILAKGSKISSSIWGIISLPNLAMVLSTSQVFNEAYHGFSEYTPAVSSACAVRIFSRDAQMRNISCSKLWRPSPSVAVDSIASYCTPPAQAGR